MKKFAVINLALIFTAAFYKPVLSFDSRICVPSRRNNIPFKRSKLHHFQYALPFKYFEESIRKPKCNPELKPRKIATTRLQSLPNASTMSAASSLALSSAVGILSNRRLKRIGDGNGIILTLFTASILSNIKFAPSNHFLYDICWSHFLPLSLSLLLLSGSTSTSSSDITSENLPVSYTRSASNQIKRLFPPFLIGCFGSIVGCTLSFFMFSSTTIKCSPFSSAIKDSLFTPQISSLAAGCLCSSYIGGSINFFSTAKILTTQLESTIQSTNLSQNTIETMFSAMATSDIVVMAIYFSFLSWSMSSKLLWRWFSRNTLERGQTVIPNDSRTEKLDIGEEHEYTLWQRIRNHIWTTTLMTIGIANVIVIISNYFEEKMNKILQGTGCAFIALFSSLAGNYLQDAKTKYQLFTQKQKQDIHHKISPFFSSLCFHLLFAAIGMNVQMKNILSQGISTLAFASFALMIHIFIIFGGSLIWNQTSFGNISLEELTVASNAAIGGPATAAAFAGNIYERTGSLKSNNDVESGPGIAKKGLILAGTIWGVIGYATGTAIGVILTRLLNTLIK